MKRLLALTLLGLCCLAAPMAVHAAPETPAATATTQAPPDEVAPDTGGGSGAAPAGPAASTNPEADKLYQQGMQLLHEGSFHDAADSLKNAVKLDGGASEIWYELAMAQAQDGDVREGKRSMQQALKLKPNDPEYHYGLAVMFLKSHDPNHGILELLQVTRLAPKEAGPWFTLGSVYEEKLDRKRAVEAYKHYVELEPNGPMAAQALSRARHLQVQDDFEEQQRRTPIGL